VPPKCRARPSRERWNRCRPSEMSCPLTSKPFSRSTSPSTTCQVAHLSVFHFARLFANTIGMPPQRYVSQRRLETGKIDLAAARVPLESISAMLMAFPNLFPSNTNLWNPGAARDPATDTLADAAVWESRSFFYRDAMVASKYAFEGKVGKPLSPARNP
jgi:hypothetical protein